MRLVIVAALLQLPQPALAKKPLDVLGEWSAPVASLRGRLVATPAKDAKGRPQLAVSIELENVGEQPLDLVWLDPNEMVHFTLTETSGAAIEEQHPGGNSLSPGPTRKTLVPKKPLRVVISRGAYAYHALDRVELRPLTFQSWFLTGSKQLVKLGAQLDGATRDAGNKPAWHGSLALPAVSVITP